MNSIRGRCAAENAGTYQGRAHPGKRKRVHALAADAGIVAEALDERIQNFWTETLSSLRVDNVFIGAKEVLDVKWAPSSQRFQALVVIYLRFREHRKEMCKRWVKGSEKGGHRIASYKLLPVLTGCNSSFPQNIRAADISNIRIISASFPQRGYVADILYIRIISSTYPQHIRSDATRLP
jgi:hypothetical protein